MIHARGLKKSFKVKRETVEAVRGIDLDVDPGQLVAFLGPNGAGKSTSLRMLTTLLPPTSGTAVVAGYDIVKDPVEVRRHIGYIGQKNSAGENFRVRDELVTQGCCYGLTRPEARRRADEILDLLSLTHLAKRGSNTLSGGQRRRLDIALGLIHQPRLLFLDEPSTGLDPHSRADIWAHILRLREEHDMTLFLTTHYLEEADNMAERVIVVDHGRVIADGTGEQLKKDLAGDHVTVTLRDHTESARAAEVAARIASAAPEIGADGLTVRVRVPQADIAMAELLRALENADVKALAAESTRPSLDDVFLALTGRSLRESDTPGA
ncbi:ATP-binding cassette domain-containing protein [Sinosporangium siamense]|uniref:ABC transporter n=1 Tax=Sinosporangium siamense TaxID=1367973 RepID=A0A919RDJ2_9ACTN|nr:ATP-binding cassette domain-containing protein [Sinosporangium siamense]GII89861.1 ABC transporter [Sinosporangium siamense]